jgi:hypothetical protein
MLPRCLSFFECPTTHLPCYTFFASLYLCKPKTEREKEKKEINYMYKVKPFRKITVTSKYNF